MNRYAVANGNWSNVATWDGGTMPQAADSVCANGYTVTIDQDVTVVLITTAALGSGAAGGGFSISAARIINASIVAGTTTCLTLGHASGTVTINGSITGGSATSAFGVRNNGSGAITVTGNVTGGSSGNTPYGIYNSSAGTITIVGNVSGGTAYGAQGLYNINGHVTITGNVSAGGTSLCYGCQFDPVAKTLTITGNVTGGSDASAHGIYVTNTGTVVITGNVLAGTLGSGILCATACNITITGAAIGNGHGPGSTGTGTAFAVIAAQGTIVNVGTLQCGSRGAWPISGPCYVSDLNAATCKVYKSDLTNATLVSALSTNNPPAVSDVRFGVAYTTGGGLVGTCNVPAAASVLYGVPVDATTGTAQVTNPAIVQQTTIATLASQTSFTLTAGSADNDTYNGLTIVVTDSSTSTQKCVGTISDYVGSTRTVTLSSDPGIFTMAVGDSVAIIAGGSGGGVVGTVDANLVSIGGDAQSATDLKDFADAGYDPATNKVQGVVLVDTVTTNTDKTGYSLASTGLDSIAVTAPSGVATTFPGMVVQLWRRFFKKATKTSTQIKTYADDGTTVVTTQTVSDDGTTETQGAAS